MSNSEDIVRLDGVSVRFRVPTDRIATIKEFAIRTLQRRIGYRDFWAVKDVSFSIRAGEMFGIVGHNGAGKSTLLKVVARVLRPTRGRVRINGRVAPLLELGAGFDKELTGRENVFLNAAIMGFTRQEIESHFDHVLDFSGLRDFIDAPLRTYSSGMIARLGFAVATMEQPDILIIDEILGVGDAEFQSKSYDRIQQFRRSGTTILLVSHSLHHVEELCSRVMWLDHGDVMGLGDPSEIVYQYKEHSKEKELAGLGQERRPVHRTDPGSDRKPIRILNVRFTDAADRESAIFSTGQTLRVHIDYVANRRVESPVFGLAIHDRSGVHITGPNSKYADHFFPDLEGPGTVTLTVPDLPLLEGVYQVSVSSHNIDDTTMYDYHDRAYTFSVLNSGKEVVEKFGLVTLRGEWDLRQSSPNKE